MVQRSLHSSNAHRATPRKNNFAVNRWKARCKQRCVSWESGALHTHLQPQQGNLLRWRCCAEFVPSPLDPAVQGAQAGVVLLIAAALPTSWWLLVVPTARQKLAVDKRRGPLRQFLERVDLEGNGVSRWFFSKWLTQMPGREKALRRNMAASSSAAERAGNTAGKLEQVVVDSDKMPLDKRSRSSVEQFVSGDNPIIVVISILGLFVAVQVASHPR